MNVLLIQLHHGDREINFFPLGLAYIAGALLSEGCEVDLVDLQMEKGTDAEKSLYERIDGAKVDMIGITAYSTQFAHFKEVVELCKSCHSEVPVVVGGPLATYSARQVLTGTKADICVKSEGDITIRRIVRSLDNLKGVKGISYREGGEIVDNGDAAYVEDLDSIDFPPYHLFDMDRYFEGQGLYGDAPTKRTMSIVTSRGCPYSCNFCSMTFKNVRRRSIENVVEEIQFFIDKYGVDSIAFIDELVISSKKRGYEICEALGKLNIKWGCQGRVNICDKELLKTMKASGCTYVGFGVESGSQKILDAMNKKVKVDQSREAVANAIEAGLFVVVQMIFGYPGEDDDSIADTVDYFKRLNYYPPYPGSPANVSLITPLPGSALYDDCVKDGIITDEIEWLNSIGRGYYPGAPLLVNFTEWDDDTLIRKKFEVEEALHENYKMYLRRHPSVFIRKALTEVMRLAGKSIIYARANGVQKTVGKVVEHFPSRLKFNKEYAKLQRSIEKKN